MPPTRPTPTPHDAHDTDPAVPGNPPRDPAPMPTPLPQELNQADVDVVLGAFRGTETDANRVFGAAYGVEGYLLSQFFAVQELPQRRALRRNAVMLERQQVMDALEDLKDRHARKGAGVEAPVNRPDWASLLKSLIPLLLNLFFGQ